MGRVIINYVFLQMSQSKWRNYTRCKIIIICFINPRVRIFFVSTISNYSEAVEYNIRHSHRNMFVILSINTFHVPITCMWIPFTITIHSFKCLPPTNHQTSSPNRTLNAQHLHLLFPPLHVSAMNVGHLQEVTRLSDLYSVRRTLLCASGTLHISVL